MLNKELPRPPKKNNKPHEKHQTKQNKKTLTNKQ